MACQLLFSAKQAANPGNAADLRDPTKQVGVDMTKRYAFGDDVYSLNFNQCFALIVHNTATGNGVIRHCQPTAAMVDNALGGGSAARDKIKREIFQTEVEPLMRE